MLTRGEARHRLAQREKEEREAVAAVCEIGPRAALGRDPALLAELRRRAAARRLARHRVSMARATLAKWMTP